MTKNDVMAMLETNLNMMIPPTGRTDVQVRTVALLEHLVTVSESKIKEQGLNLPAGTTEEPYSVEQGNLVMMYASYLYRERVTNEGMPRALRYALNNAIFAQKAKA